LQCVGTRFVATTERAQANGGTCVPRTHCRGELRGPDCIAEREQLADACLGVTGGDPRPRAGDTQEMHAKHVRQRPGKLWSLTQLRGFVELAPFEQTIEQERDCVDVDEEFPRPDGLECLATVRDAFGDVADPIAGARRCCAR
jgi:hypothetical protein